MSVTQAPGSPGVLLEDARPGRPAEPAPPPWRRYASLRHPVTAAALTAAVLHLVWALFLAAEGGDLAAQAAWTDFAAEHPGAAYSFSWYGGMHPASYSVVSPYVMALFGIRTVATVTGVVSAVLTAHLLVRFRAPVALPAAVWAAFALTCNSASGRTTFGLGLTFALVATILVFTRRGTPALRGAGMVACGLLASLASPVAGLFLLVLAGALVLTRRFRVAVAIGVGLPVVSGTTSLLFPFSGVQPISFDAIVLPAVTSVLAILCCAPATWRFVRIGAGVYLAGILLTWLIPSPVGSNVERLSLLFGGMVLLVAVGRTRDRIRLTALSLAFVVTAAWQVVKPVDDIVHTEPAARAADHARGLVAELEALDADESRIEVVPLRSHWESAGLARGFVLARGWNRQVDAERHELFYEDGALTAESYRAWLHEWAVKWVVLPAQEVDWAAEEEAALVRSEPAYLAEVWRDEHWRLFRVRHATPLVDAPGTVARLDAGELVVDMPSAGSVLVRAAWSPWLDVTGGGCLRPEGGFVRMDVPSAGRYTLAARYGALSHGTRCAS
ncbi:MFS transporter [Actinomadura sp. LOL_016]|uniref:MFS transporter n=1 Tax=unclassified Actinomadura TaxID=2626254 RepID=UPI003A80A4E4